MHVVNSTLPVRSMISVDDPSGEECTMQVFVFSLFVLIEKHASFVFITSEYRRSIPHMSRALFSKYFMIVVVHKYITHNKILHMYLLFRYW